MCFFSFCYFSPLRTVTFLCPADASMHAQNSSTLITAACCLDQSNHRIRGDVSTILAQDHCGIAAEAHLILLCSTSPKGARSSCGVMNLCRAILLPDEIIHARTCRISYHLHKVNRFHNIYILIRMCDMRREEMPGEYCQLPCGAQGIGVPTRAFVKREDGVMMTRSMISSSSRS